MKIVMINGSNRKDGATALILEEMFHQLKKYSDTDIKIYHVADLNLQYCRGCCQCYKTGKCIFTDDIENLSLEIESADGIVLGSPTYASNVSAQMKVIIDRGHFVIEQLLHGKYAISVATYENYGGKDTAKILNQCLSYSGAQISASILSKIPFSTNPLNNAKFKKLVQNKASYLHQDIQQKRKHIFQKLKHFIIFRIGILPFVLRKGKNYDGVINHWKKRNIEI